MTNLIKTDTFEYPISIQEFNSRFPNNYIPASDWGLFGYAEVIPTAPPDYDPITQTTKEISPLQVDGVWQQAWEVVELDADTIVANQQRQKEQNNQALLSQILALQQKALRSLVEDAPDTTWLDKYKAQIASLRAQIVQ